MQVPPTSPQPRGESSSGEQTHTKPNLSTATEQYKLLFNVIVNLNDNFVKSILTIFTINAAIFALVFQNFDKNSSAKNMLLINYGIIAVFGYYLWYLRTRVKSMMKIAKDIETKCEPNFFKGIATYDETIKGSTRWLFSTTGLILLSGIALIGTNSYLYFVYFTPHATTQAIQAPVNPGSPAKSTTSAAAIPVSSSGPSRPYY